MCPRVSVVNLCPLPCLITSNIIYVLSLRALKQRSSRSVLVSRCVSLSSPLFVRSVTERGFTTVTGWRVRVNWSPLLPRCSSSVSRAAKSRRSRRCDRLASKKFRVRLTIALFFFFFFFSFYTARRRVHRRPRRDNRSRAFSVPISRFPIDARCHEFSQMVFVLSVLFAARRFRKFPNDFCQLEAFIGTEGFSPGVRAEFYASLILCVVMDSTRNR